MLRSTLALLALLTPLAPLQASSTGAEGAASRVEAMRGWATENGYLPEGDSELLVFRPADRALSARRRSTRSASAVPLTDITDAGRELWGGTEPAQEEPACLFVLRDAADMRSLNRHLAALPGCEYLASWAGESASFSSFLHQEPLVAGILLAPDGVEEWSVPHESASFGARLLLQRQFGRVPLWLELGAGLHMQMELKGDLYSFPYRAGFVGIGEHGGWDRPLGKAFKGFTKGRADAYSVDQVASYPRGEFDEERISLIWGFWRYVTSEQPEALGPLLQDMGEAVRAGVRQDTYNADGSFSFTIDPTYEPTSEGQVEILQTHLGADFLERVSVFLEMGEKRFDREWSRYEKKRD